MAAVGWDVLAAFALTVLLAAIFALTAAGHFPRVVRSPALSTPPGTALLWGTIAVAGIAAATSVTMAIGMLPWPYAIVAGGLALLLAPLVLQRFPDSIVDGRRGLVLFSGAAALMAVAMAWLT